MSSGLAVLELEQPLWVIAEVTVPAAKRDVLRIKARRESFLSFMGKSPGQFWWDSGVVNIYAFVKLRLLLNELHYLIFKDNDPGCQVEKMWFGFGRVRLPLISSCVTKGYVRKGVGFGKKHVGQSEI